MCIIKIKSCVEFQNHRLFPFTPSTQTISVVASSIPSFLRPSYLNSNVSSLLQAEHTLPGWTCLVSSSVSTSQNFKISFQFWADRDFGRLLPHNRIVLTRRQCVFPSECKKKKKEHEINMGWEVQSTDHFTNNEYGALMLHVPKHSTM